MFGALATALSAVAGRVVGIFEAREQTRAHALKAKGKLLSARETNLHELAMSRAEWEALMAEGSQGSWKDEFWTIVLAGPFIMLLLGSVLEIFIGDDRLLLAANRALAAFKEVGLDYGLVLYIAIGAAFGIRLTKK